MELTTDLIRRREKLQQSMKAAGVEACVIATNVNLYYLSGMIFGGYLFLPAEGEPLYFVKRPSGLKDPRVVYIRKPEDIPDQLGKRNIPLPGSLGLEGDLLSYNDYIRLQAVFNPQKTINITPLLRKIRSVKSDREIDQFRISARKHSEAYSKIRSCYFPGMTDVEFQACIEKEMRMLGSIGYFRGFGNNMEIHMGSILTGDNAEAPSPFDFALGGKGMHPSIPIGADGSILQEGHSVMVDMAGNYTAYITDMTRTFAIGKLPDLAYKAHRVSLDIQNEIIKISKPGTSCAELYNLSLAMAEAAGLSSYFMGTSQQAKFVGHGVGIEINELPILTGRSKEVLEPGVVFALEPKFVLPGIGAVGIENTFLVTSGGLEKLTLFEEEIIPLT